MPPRGTPALPALIALLLAGALLSACGNDSTPSATTSSSTSSPPSSPATATPTGQPDAQPALAAYKKFLTAQETLNMVNKDHREAHLQPYATGEALKMALELKAKEDQETGLRFYGSPAPRPQVVAWGNDGITIFDCQDNRAHTRTLNNGTSLGPLPDQLVITLMAPTQTHEWKANTLEVGQGTCSSPQSYNTATPPTYPPQSDEVKAIEAYKKYREVSYALTRYPEAQRKQLLEKYASGDEVATQLKIALENQNNGLKNSTGPLTYPLIVETQGDYYRIYDCYDKSSAKFIDKDGDAWPAGNSGTPTQSSVEKNEKGNWVVTDSSEFLGVCR